jgi:transcription elongation factor Elf1
MSFKIEVDAEDMKFDLGKERIDLPCPKCKTTNSVTFDQAKHGESITCVNCHSTIRLVDKNGSVRKVVTDVNDAFDDLRGALDDLGR